MNRIPYSDETDEMLSKTPSKLLTLGNFAIVIVITIFFSITTLLNYSDKVDMQILVKAQPDFFEFSIEKNAIVEVLHYSEGDFVDSGALIAEVYNEVSYSTIKKLETIVNELSIKMDSNSEIDFKIDYSDLHTSSLEISSYLRRLQNYITLIKRKSESDFDIQVYAQLDDLILQILKYTQHWKEKNLFIAPFDGHFLTMSPVNNNNINSDHRVLSLIPKEYHYLGEMRIPVKLFDELTIEENFDINMLEFEEKKYGTISAKVTKITKVPNMSDDVIGAYRSVFVIIENNAVSSKGIAIPTISQFHGVVSIKKEQESIWQRAWTNFRTKGGV